MRYADGVLSISKNWTRNRRLYSNLFLAEQSQNGQYFQRRQANAALTAAVRPFGALATPFTEANPWAVRLKCVLGYAHAQPAGLLGSEDSISM